MTQILLVRMSSLGDILHTFPAVTDLRRARPDAAIDWVVEEAYVPLVRLHPGVTRIIPLALRRWRRRPFDAATWRQFADWKRAVQEKPYDAILDTQGLAKSLFVAKTARGPVHGFGPHTAREAWVARFYDKTYEFAPSEHKVERYRDVAAKALGYQKSSQIDYGIVAPPKPPFAPSERYCVLLHATAREGKLWNERAWMELGRALEARGVTCVLPWGDEAERLRSVRIGEALKKPLVPPKMELREACGVVGHAAAVIGVDTGLMHLAAALRVPVVGIFTDSEPLDAKPLGAGRTAFRGGIGTPPSAADVLAALGEVEPSLR